MRAIFHQRVYSDIEEILAYYERVATQELADAFYQEFRHAGTPLSVRPGGSPPRWRCATARRLPAGIRGAYDRPPR
jgi:hypothetical protein